ncbi:glutamine synthetase family protein [Acetanaerobacterium elongatum]|uniref:L-glutamine synthetase n=1 Tax=Acetanaerobacterium elongatum TaxID=258515 RepID=A0A1G9XWC8_9FIRM|nr:glutamine synthetase family protein [Acetanaerobacterium elongatum]SDN00543.1 L-glutamine synthetase [Acetanaerobacterium elongatum]
MDYTATEVLQFVRENDVKFIRLAFCDVFGTLKNMSIMSDELSRAFEQGIFFDASAVNGFTYVEESELCLFPDPSTLSVLPWRPQQGRVVRLFCDIKHQDGSPFEGDGRYILRNAIQKAEEMGYTCRIGSDCEFYLFEADDDGRPTKTPHDSARYFDVAPLDKGENVRRDICLTLEEMDIKPESSHHEMGPGQNEIDFKSGAALRAADNFATFKSVVKTMAARNGLFASFMPKPIHDECGSGLHIKISLYKSGFNIFHSEQGEMSTEGKSFIAGLLKYARETTIFLNPLTNSYARLCSPEGLKYVGWSSSSLSQILRVPGSTSHTPFVELRSSDPSCNPYIAFALALRAGLSGIEKNLPLADTLHYIPSQANVKVPENKLSILPESLFEAIVEAQNSSFLSTVLPAKTIDNFLMAKRREWEKFSAHTDKDGIERDMYFNTI